MSSIQTLTLLEQPSNQRVEQLRSYAKFVSDIFDSDTLKASTKRNLKSDWSSWLSFIESDIGMNAFALLTPEQQQTPLMAYCHYLVGKNLKAITIRRRLSGLNAMLQLLGINDGLNNNPRFAFFKKNLLEKMASPSEQATPFRINHVIESLGTATSSGNIRLQRAALIVQLGYDSLCRASEMIEVRQSDIQFNPNGTATLFVKKSKNDQAAIGSYRALSATTTRLIKEWMAMANKVGRTEYLLCPVNAHSNAVQRLSGKEKPISYCSVLNDIKLFGSEFSVHSTRVGALLDLVADKAENYEIQLAGGWKNSTMIAYYARKLNTEEGAMKRLFKKIGR